MRKFLIIILLSLAWISFTNADEQAASSTKEEISKKRFEMTYEASQSLHSRHRSAVMTHLAALVAVTGWLCTSEKTRESLKNDVKLQKFSRIAIYASFFSTVGWSYTYWSASRKLQDLLSTINYKIGEDFYSLYSLDLRCRILGHLALLLGMHVFLFCLVRSFSRK